MRRSLLYSIFFVLTKVHASTPAGPTIAEVVLQQVAAPAPTARPHIFERESKSLTTVCGYQNGDLSSPVACNNGGICGYNTKYDWWGCCEGATLSASQYFLTGCLVQTACVDFSTIAECDSSCLANTMVLKCSNEALPYCATSTLNNDFLSVFNCAIAPVHLTFAEYPATSSTTSSSTGTPPGTSAVPNPLYTPSDLSYTPPISTAAPTTTITPSAPPNPLVSTDNLIFSSQTSQATSSRSTSPTTSLVAHGSSAQKQFPAFYGASEWATSALIVLSVAFVYIIAG